MISWNRIKYKLKVNKEGMLIGVLVGIILTIWLKATGANLTFAMQSVGIVDKIIGTSMSIKDIMITKVGTTLVIFCGVIGYIIDDIWKPNR